ncbi:MAG TPA: nucleoside deaminase [Casimicrobiaceae bacterium]|nr:nucleoside deaminase [Casimicrobiaceae bacterium]
MTVRRRLIVRMLVAVPLAIGAVAARGEAPSDAFAKPSRRWFDEALRMRRLAERAGDQPYGAVLVLDDRLVGEGPSRVVELGDATAHAERVAIRDAQRRLGRSDLRGSILVSTSRPCAACETAAALAGVSRMFYGEELRDAGAPKA